MHHPPPPPPTLRYKSPRRVQVWFLARSRRLWKTKYSDLKVQHKRLQNRLRDVTKSRDAWRAEAAQLRRHAQELQAQRAALPTGGGEKKNAPAEPDEPVGDHGYSAVVVLLCLGLVQVGVSLRGTSRVLLVLAAVLGWPTRVPHWTTVRLWLQRQGHALLTDPVTPADDWAWLVDHSAQAGQHKCLAVLGVPLSGLPPPGQALGHPDVRLIDLILRPSWTRAEVDAVLEQTAERAGVPRLIVDDHGVDLAGGVERFRRRHPQTAETYDLKHKAACLLKGRLERDGRWQDFQARVAQTRSAVQQTELAFLAPPGARPKARFMNLGPLLGWARRVLAVVEQPPPRLLQWVTAERLREKLGWVADFQADLGEWSEWQTLIDTAAGFVARKGLYTGADADLRAALPGLSERASSRLLASALVGFVAEQSGKAQPGERLVGSTEVLESGFAKLKALEKGQARGGFTSLVLGFAALLTTLTVEGVRRAFAASPVKAVRQWCAENLGTTVFAQRRLAFQCSATDSG